MSTRVIDELITKYTLNASQYTAGANQATAATQSLANAQAGPQGATGATGSLLLALGAVSSIASLAVQGLHIVESAVDSVASALERAVGALVAFSEKSYETFQNWQAMQLSFTGFLGGQGAQQMGDYLKQFSQTSPFKLMDTSQIALEMTQLRLDVNRFLPLVQMMATGMGKPGSAQAMEDVLEILREIKGGRIAMALGPRGIGRFGISRLDLEKYGAQFSGAGSGDVGAHFQGTSEQALDIVAKVIQDRFAKAAEEVGKGAKTIVSDWHDALDQLEVSWGEQISSLVTPIIADLTNVSNAFSSSGAVGSFVQHLLNATVGSGGLGLGAGKNALIEGLLSLGEVVIDGAHLLAAVFEGIKSSVEEFLWVVGSALNVAKRFIPGMGSVGDIDLTQVGKSFLGLDIGEDWVKQARGDLAGLSKNPEKKVAPSTGDDADQAPVQTAYLSQIASNTSAMKGDLRKFALGGGDLGRMGVTPMEMSSYFRRGISQHGGRQRSLGNAIDEYIDERISEMLRGLMSNRMFPTSR